MKLKKPIPKPVQSDDLMEINQALFDVPQLQRSFYVTKEIYDIISPPLQRIAEELAEIFTANALSINADFGSKLKQMAYPDPELPVEKIELPVSYSTEDSSASISLKKPHFRIWTNGSVKVKGTEAQLFPLDIELTINPFCHMKRKIEHLRQETEALEHTYLDVISNSKTGALKDHVLVIRKDILDCTWEDFNNIKSQYDKGDLDLKPQYLESLDELESALQALDKDLQGYEV